MSIKTKLDRLIAIKTAITNSIKNKGITLPSLALDKQVFRKLANYIRAIKSVQIVSTNLFYESVHKQSYFYNAPSGVSWRPVTVNFGNTFYDLKNSEQFDGPIVYPERFFGVTGDYYTPWLTDIHQLNTLYVNGTSGLTYRTIFEKCRLSIKVAGKYDSNYNEGSIIFRSGNVVTCVFCMRNFRTVYTDIPGFSGGVWPAERVGFVGCLEVDYNINTGNIIGEYRWYDLDTGEARRHNDNPRWHNMSDLIYSSRFIWIFWFSNGLTCPDVIYPRSFAVKINSDLIKFKYLDLPFKYCGYGLHIRLRSESGVFRNSIYIEAPMDHVVHEYTVPSDFLRNVGVAILEFTGFITGFGYKYLEIDNPHYLMACVTEILTPLPDTLQWADYLFEHSNITVVPKNLMSRCYNRISSVTGMFRCCDNLGDTANELFAKCTRISSFDFLYSHCKKLRTVHENTFLTSSSVRSIRYAFEGCYIASHGDFTKPIESTIEDMSYLFAEYGNRSDVQYLWVDLTVSFLPSKGDFPKLRTVEGLFYHSQHIKSLKLEILNTPLLTNLSRLVESNGTHNLLSATVNISTRATGMDLHKMFYDQQRLENILFSFAAPSASVDNADLMFYMDTEITYCPTLWNNRAFSKASHNGCFYMCFGASNYQDALNHGWATYTQIG